MTLLAFNKPYGVLSQFTDGNGRPTLADHIPIAGVYPAGRLDRDSEGLLLLTDDGVLQARITAPGSRLWKRYHAQVEHRPDAAALANLRAGVMIDGRRTLPAQACLLTGDAAPWPRDPPIRFRKQIPTCWLELGIHEGRNRQVRKMTAAIGHPTLRLIRVAIGPVTLDGLSPGEWRELDPALLAQHVGGKPDGAGHRPPSMRRRPHA